MRLRIDHAAHRPKPAAAIRRLGALTLLLCLLPYGGIAEAVELPFFPSEFAAEGYPAPEVPVCSPVPDSYFEGAVLIGDSLASAFDIHLVVPELRTLTDIGLSARTANGNKTFHIEGTKYKVTLLEALETLSPRILYLWLGSNGLDIKDEIRTLADYEQLLNYLLPHYPDTLVYLLSVPPVKSKVTQRYAYFSNARIDAFNTGLRELAARYRVYYLDINALLRNDQGELDNEYGTGDGIHLRSGAYDLMAEYLYTHAIPLEDR